MTSHGAGHGAVTAPSTLALSPPAHVEDERDERGLRVVATLERALAPRAALERALELAVREAPRPREVVLHLPLLLAEL